MLKLFIPVGFRVKFSLSNFAINSAKYFPDISLACNSFSRSIMRSTIRAMCAKRDFLSRAIFEYIRNLSDQDRNGI